MRAKSSGVRKKELVDPSKWMVLKKHETMPFFRFPFFPTPVGFIYASSIMHIIVFRSVSSSVVEKKVLINPSTLFFS